MPRHATIHARIARLDLDPSGRGYLLGWYSPRSPAIFETARQAVADLPPGERFYVPERRCWYVSQRALLELVPRWPLLAESLAALGGHAQSSNSSSSSHASSSSSAAAVVPRQVADAYERLCLRPGAPLELVKAARKAYARLYHPDLGGASGDQERLKQLNAACDVVEAFTREAVGAM